MKHNYPGKLLYERVYYGRLQSCQYPECQNPATWVQGRYGPIAVKGRTIREMRQLVCGDHASEAPRAWAGRWMAPNNSEDQDGKMREGLGTPAR